MHKYSDFSFIYDHVHTKIPLREALSTEWGLQKHRPEKNIDLNSEAVALGCSMTSGFAIDQDFIWPSLLQKYKNIKVNNLAEQGTGISWQIIRFFEYISLNKTPKKIFCLFPDPSRIHVPQIRYASKRNEPRDIRVESDIDPEKLIAHLQYDQSLPDFTFPGNQRYHFTDYKNQKYPIPIEIAIYLNLVSLSQLETLCLVADIDLKYIFWVDGELVNKIEGENSCKRFNTPDDVGNTKNDPLASKWGDPWDLSCGHQPVNKRQQELWARARDGLHAGLHHHIHFCETLIEEKISQDFIEEI